MQLGKDLASLQNNEDLSRVQKKQIEVQINGNEHFALCEDSRSKLLELYENSENLFAVKILQFTPALPLYDNTKPYQPIIFAYSIMQINGDENSIELFISDGKSNPNIEIITQLNTLAENKRFISYNNKNESIEGCDLRNICVNNSFYHPAMIKEFSNKELSKALGIKPAWKSIESDIVAAQYYDEVLRGHKKSEEKYAAIEAYLRKEVLLVQKFMKKIQTHLER